MTLCFMKCKRMHILFFLVFLGLLAMSLWRPLFHESNIIIIDPTFDIAKYKRFYADGSMGHASLFSGVIGGILVKHHLLMIPVGTDARIGDIAVAVNYEEGLCIPPVVGVHFQLRFFAPKKVIISLHDATTGKLLLSYSYQRGVCMAHAGLTGEIYVDICNALSAHQEKVGL